MVKTMFNHARKKVKNGSLGHRAPMPRIGINRLLTHRLGSLKKDLTLLFSCDTLYLSGGVRPVGHLLTLGAYPVACRGPCSLKTNEW